MPAFCLCAAEALRPGVVEHVGMLPVDMEPLDLSAAIAAGQLISHGVDWRIQGFCPSPTCGNQCANGIRKPLITSSGSDLFVSSAKR